MFISFLYLFSFSVFISLVLIDCSHFVILCSVFFFPFYYFLPASLFLFGFVVIICLGFVVSNCFLLFFSSVFVLLVLCVGFGFCYLSWVLFVFFFFLSIFSGCSAWLAASWSTGWGSSLGLRSESAEPWTLAHQRSPDPRE